MGPGSTFVLRSVRGTYPCTAFAGMTALFMFRSPASGVITVP
jgi:hypothetical protein